MPFMGGGPLRIPGGAGPPAAEGARLRGGGGMPFAIGGGRPIGPRGGPIGGGPGAGAEEVRCPGCCAPDGELGVRV